ncbi:MAG: hypothetical protein AAGB22_05450 [Bacteroidota bacterium]
MALSPALTAQEESDYEGPSKEDLKVMEKRRKEADKAAAQAEKEKQKAAKKAERDRLREEQAAKMKNFFKAPDKDEVVKYDPTEVLDPKFGIQQYEPLNLRTGKDSVRLCRGIPCEGWVVDKYVTDKMFHRGFYVKGKLQFYKNYFPDGTVERDFKVMDDHRSSMKLFYPSGQLKSHIKYRDELSVFWEDYYANGNLDYHEAYNKEREYYTAQKSYQENGTPIFEMELTDKKNQRYTRTEYHPNGKVKSQGQMRYNLALVDYQRTGLWKTFDDSGKALQELDYVNGKVVETKDL